MFYSKKILNDKYILESSSQKYAKQQAELQSIVFPTLSAEELITEKKYLSHIKYFPEGQLLVRDGERVIASSTTIRLNFSSKPHTFLEVSGDLWLTTNNPNGEWMYGLDVSVHPDFQGKGIGRAIYNSRQEIAKQIGCHGQITVGMPNGYKPFSDKMTIEEYCEKLHKGELTDPTVTAQTKFGFKWLKPIYNYLNDPQSGNAGILMYWPLDKNFEINI